MFTTSRPIIIAGPCSVESRQQLRSIALSLSAMPQVSMIRAGVWKPRTRPGGFEGLGEPALAWMQQLSAELGTRFCCEVARPEQADLCLRYGITALWIGARTTTNPFMVDELCSALRGSGATVMVKNPVCPDVRLWLGAIERLDKAGISDVAAIHRGFDMFNNQGYRNAPLWELPMQLRRELPQVPILCDPSHIGGQASLVPSIAHTARLLNYDGLIVEVHPNPAEALTDAAQQLTPSALATIIADWQLPTHATDASTHAALEPLRRRIDAIDHDILALLAQRMEAATAIADVKRRTNTAVYQPDHWADVMADRLAQAHDLHLSPSFIKDIMEKIHAESVRVQLDTAE